MLRRVWFGVGGGLLAGALVGIGESLFILSTAGTGEYVALVYAAVLYGVIGASLGVVVGLCIALLGKLVKKLTDPAAFTLSLLAGGSTLGVLITHYAVNKAVYSEQGVPPDGLAVILGVFGFLGLLGLWLCPIFLTRTPLKILMEVRGTGALYGAVVLLCGVLGMAPGAGVGRDLAPDRAAGPGLAGAPDVILVVADTLRADRLGVYGGGAFKTPAIDDFARDSVVFRESFAQASWTRASFATLFSSTLPSSHTCSTKGASLPNDVETVAEALSSHGYATGGLPNSINVTRSFNFQQGFDYFAYQTPSTILGATESAAQLSMYKVLRWVRDRVIGDEKRVQDYYQPAEVVFKNARTYITANRAKGNRYFLVIHLMDAHDPYFEHPYNGVAVGRAWLPNPEPSDADSLLALYDGEVQHLDLQFGAFLDWLKAEGIYDDAMVVFTSDHGEEFFEHQGWWHGLTLYDEQLHVPLIIKLPNGDLAGEAVDWQVRLMDVSPTILDRVGAPRPGSWQGQDLFDPAALQTLRELKQAAAAAQAIAAAPPVVDDAGLLVVLEPTDVAPDLHALERVVVAEQDFEGNVLAALRTQGWKYIRANGGNPRGLPANALYDVESAVGERVNLFAQEPGRVAGLSAELRAHLEDAASVGVDADETRISCEECNRMMMLGYVSECSGPCGR